MPQNGQKSITVSEETFNRLKQLAAQQKTSIPRLLVNWAYSGSPTRYTGADYPTRDEVRDMVQEMLVKFRDELMEKIHHD